ncbi:MAG TPA: isochorismatase family cysteine hydrolase [Acidimicrobiales bacterium]|nr:isochorismatase family cysteine hydrolase [Acidimicrobiales bacterium]
MSIPTSIELDRSRSALIVFDAVEQFRAAIEAHGALQPIITLARACREAGLPRFFSRGDHRPDGRDRALTVPDMDREHRPYAARAENGTGGYVSGSAGTAYLAELEVGPEDYDIPKHRWSAFFATPLDLSLRRLGVDTLLIVGGSFHIGVASTIYAARDLDYQIVAVAEGCHAEPAEREALLELILPQVCHVRSLAAVLEALG